MTVLVFGRLGVGELGTCVENNRNVVQLMLSIFHITYKSSSNHKPGGILFLPVSCNPSTATRDQSQSSLSDAGVACIVNIFSASTSICSTLISVLLVALIAGIAVKLSISSWLTGRLGPPPSMVTWLPKPGMRIPSASMRLYCTSWLSDDGWREIDPLTVVPWLWFLGEARPWRNWFTRGPRVGTAVVIKMMFSSTVEAWKYAITLSKRVRQCSGSFTCTGTSSSGVGERPTREIVAGNEDRADLDSPPNGCCHCTGGTLVEAKSIAMITSLTIS